MFCFHTQNIQRDNVPMKDSYPPCAAFHKNVAFFYLKAGFLFLIFEFVYTKCCKSLPLLYHLQIHIRHM